MNTFHPIELLPAAAEQGSFPWDPDGDEEREAGLPDRAAVLAYAGGIAGAWTAWLQEHAVALDPSRQVDTPRGRVALGDLLLSQRWHAAFHYRQLRAVLAAGGLVVPGTLEVESLAGLELPADVF